MIDGKLAVGIIGCGLIGQKRAASVSSLAKVAMCYDPDGGRAGKLTSLYGAESAASWENVVKSSVLDIVIVATPHDKLPFMALEAAKTGKHVLLEKPGARSAYELEVLLPFKDKIRFGYNHRFHQAIRKAKEIWHSGAAGEPMMMRARYGHGGRVGYDKEWRAVKEISGGGEMIDQGSHLIDLARYFFGDMELRFGTCRRYFWNMEVEDNGFAILENKKRNIAMLHASCTEWKNTFSLELYGKTGKIEVSGLGGSYGPERVTFYHMTPQMGPPNSTTWEYPVDDSWSYEFGELLDDMRLGRIPSPGVEDAIAVLRIVEGTYEGFQP